MRSSKPLLALIVALALPACEPSSPVAPVDGQPQLTYMNGPDELPNVIRFGAEYTINIVDLNTDLRAFAGLPDDPSSHILCQQFGFTGTETFETSPIQDAGQLQEVIHRIANDGEANLHVYRLSTFNGFCRTPVLARGVGRLMAADNDLTFSGTRTNTWGWHMTGPVTILATGETAMLNAQNRFEGSATDPVRLLFRRVLLN